MVNETCHFESGGEPAAPPVGAEGVSERLWGEGFGVLLRSRRSELGLSLTELAARTGAAKSYLSALENGHRRTPREPVLVALERALLLPPGRLLGAAGWERTPGPIKREVEHLASDRRRRDGLARRLTEILAGSTTDGGGRIRGSLDEAYRSGELRRLVDRLAPEESAIDSALAPQSDKDSSSLRHFHSPVPSP